MIYRSIIATTFVCIYFSSLLFCPNLASAQPKIYIPPGIDWADRDQGFLYKNKQPYLLLRRQLLRRGWKPIIREDIALDKDIYGNESEINDLIGAGFIEIQKCKGVEITDCVFKFRRGDYCLAIRTVGEYNKKYKSPVVYSESRRRCRSGFRR